MCHPPWNKLQSYWKGETLLHGVVGVIEKKKKKEIRKKYNNRQRFLFKCFFFYSSVFTQIRNNFYSVLFS